VGRIKRAATLALPNRLAKRLHCQARHSDAACSALGHSMK
jgi:hypothetical protein